MRNHLRFRHARPDHPASLILILLADILNELVGTLFAAAMIPGLMLAGIYVVYMLGLGFFRPQMVPAVPKDERDLISATDSQENC